MHIQVSKSCPYLEGRGIEVHTGIKVTTNAMISVTEINILGKTTYLKIKDALKVKTFHSLMWFSILVIFQKALGSITTPPCVIIGVNTQNNPGY